MDRISFTKYEHEILPNYRQKISMAESTEDVKKFFIYTVKDLFENISKGQIAFHYEDLALTWHRKPYYKLSNRLISSEIFNQYWTDSDLPRVLSRLAETALHRYKHLKKSPEKTDAKIRR